MRTDWKDTGFVNWTKITVRRKEEVCDGGIMIGRQRTNAIKYADHGAIIIDGYL